MLNSFTFLPISNLSMSSGHAIYFNVARHGASINIFKSIPGRDVARVFAWRGQNFSLLLREPKSFAAALEKVAQRGADSDTFIFRLQFFFFQTVFIMG